MIIDCGSARTCGKSEAGEGGGGAVVEGEEGMKCFKGAVSVFDASIYQM